MILKAPSTRLITDPAGRLQLARRCFRLLFIYSNRTVMRNASYIATHKAVGMLVDIPSCGLWFCAKYCHTMAASKEIPFM